MNGIRGLTSSAVPQPFIFDPAGFFGSSVLRFFYSSTGTALGSSVNNVIEFVVSTTASPTPSPQPTVTISSNPVALGGTISITGSYLAPATTSSGSLTFYVIDDSTGHDYGSVGTANMALTAGVAVPLNLSFKLPTQLTTPGNYHLSLTEYSSTGTALGSSVSNVIEFAVDQD